MSGECIDVCIATLRRAGELRRLLDSLATQENCGARVRVVVVDNDPEGSAGEVAETFRRVVNAEVLYAIEPRRGISAARNRALALVDADYVAFIDDDEIASPGWLKALLATLKTTGADGVFGPSAPVLPADAPAWSRRLPMFERPQLKTGTSVPHGATNNVMLRVRVLRDPQARFDDAFGLTGGEDVDFFTRLASRGAKFVWCDEAEVFEPVPRSRLNEEWVLTRSYRSGQTVYRLFVAPLPAWEKAPRLALKCVQACGGWILGMSLRLAGADSWMKWLAAARRAGGQVSGFAGRAIIREYDVANRR
jgi:succinoglycan biosynthesis protein ExoM